MKLDSKYFDMIRISRASRQADQTQRVRTGCQWHGCDRPGLFRAPKAGTGNDGQYLLLCPDHIREHNAAYNYFEGMSDSEIADFQKAAVYGHRPTWKIGSNTFPDASRWRTSRANGRGFPRRDAGDKYSSTSGASDRGGGTRETRRQLKPLERKSLDSLNLPETASRVEIKARFKELVKRNHPDSNGGDRGSEEKLREIIQAYNYLKAAGLV